MCQQMMDPERFIPRSFRIRQTIAMPGTADSHGETRRHGGWLLQITAWPLAAMLVLGCQPAQTPAPSEPSNSTSSAAAEIPPIDQTTERDSSLAGEDTSAVDSTTSEEATDTAESPEETTVVASSGEVDQNTDVAEVQTTVGNEEVQEVEPADSSAGNGSVELTTADATPNAGESNESPNKVTSTDPTTVGNPSENATLEQGDWAQWGGSCYRNNVPIAKNIPADWSIGTIDRRTSEWSQEGAKNIKWVFRVGSQTYGNPVVADGQVYIGTNNAASYLPRYPAKVDLGCLIAIRESDGEFLWQHSSEKLSTGRVHDWPLQGICCAPLVEGDRLWFVSSRGHIVCLDTKGYYDGEDDGPVEAEAARLFKENPTLHAGMDDGLLSDTLRAVLTQNGVDLQGRVRVKPREADATWLLSVKQKKVTHYYQIQLVDGQLGVHRLDSEEQLDPSEDAKIVSVEVRLDAGFAEGRVSGGFRALCRERGFGFDADPEVTVVEPKQKWSATLTVDGMLRTVNIRQQGPSLVASVQLSTSDVTDADTVWVYDMMSELQVSQHNMCSCSVTVLGDILFVNTSNGVDQTHKNIPSINSPSFMAMNKHTGEVYWTDASPGKNILHGQWSSPTIGVLGGVPQVVFAGGDGWVYSFRADKGQDGKPELLWSFDANPKTSEWVLGGRGTRNNIIATPVIYDGLVYAAVGQDPEHGDGNGHLWCIDPSKRGDVSAELAVRVDDREQVIPHRRLQAVIEDEGEVAIDNPNSAVVWHFDTYDQNGDGEIDFHEEMHRSCGTVAIKDDILFIADFSGIFHCLHAKTGKVHWSYDMFSAAWGSPLIVDGKVYIGDEEGEVSVFPLTTDPAVALVGEEDDRKPAIAEIDMDNSVYSTPIVANGVLFVANRTHVFAITHMPDDELAERD